MINELKRKKLDFPLYLITAENLSNGKTNIEVVKEMINSGAKIIQYREKYKEVRQKYEECKIIRDITKKAGVTFIINDNIDIAMLVKPDGVHIGQDDLPIEEVRKLLGEEMIIGLSTHCKEQAQEAVKKGADYIGAGPVYETHTKDNVCAPVGLSYIEYVQSNINIPYVAIGGIKEYNINEVLEKGAKCICLVSDIVQAENIGNKIKTLLNYIKNYKK